MTRESSGREAPLDLRSTDPWRNPVRWLLAAERSVFLFVGVLFFIAAFALGFRAIGDLVALVVAPSDAMIGAGVRFLDVMLLSLMIVELAYTVILSLRGAALLPEPFLLVGLIAVIRRMLVITVGEVPPGGRGAAAAVTGAGSQPVELGILTGVVLALVASIVLLRRRPAVDDFDDASAGAGTHS